MEVLKKYISLVIIYLFNCLPIKKNKIFLFSYYGSQYGCSPKYITEYILKTYPKDCFDLVWAFNDPDSKVDIEGIRKVKTMSLRYFYELCTSKVLITNFRTTDLFIKRKEQYYIQTWHSSLRLKQIEKDAEGNLPASYVQMAKKDSKKCDLLLSGCEYSTKIFKQSFWYEGEIFNFGTPANDVLLENDPLLIKKIYKKLNLHPKYKIALYAPTFRKDNNTSVYDLDYVKTVKSLEEKFSGDWILLIRFHPHLSNTTLDLDESKRIINVTSYDDIQELLLISDVLITDYSSVMFSFLLTKKPCFLYTPDITKYVDSDRKLYFEIGDLPFQIAKNNPVLCENITNFNYKNYLEKVNTMISTINSFEHGNACSKLLEKIEKQIG
jgi:CDP-glycerol glycerophosphotransferase